jgi:hypothetical protein
MPIINGTLDLGSPALLVVVNGRRKAWMEDLEVREVREKDASELATLLNEIIARGGTTALEEPFAPDALARTLLIGLEVIFCSWRSSERPAS